MFCAKISEAELRCSSNGTFVNNQVVGKNVTIELQDRAEIMVQKPQPKGSKRGHFTNSLLTACLDIPKIAFRFLKEIPSNSAAENAASEEVNNLLLAFLIVLLYCHA